MAKQRQVLTFDLTDSGDRGLYEDFLAGSDDRVLKEQDFPMGGTGQIMRVVDYEHEDGVNAENELPYKKPVC